MNKIFISYRRTDSADVVRGISDHVMTHFGRERVFLDIDTMRGGFDFRYQLTAALKECQVVLAVIGTSWLSRQGILGLFRRRIDSRNDFVRMEIEMALERLKHIIPVLVNGASMPSEKQLPHELRRFAYLQAISIYPVPDFNKSVGSLIRTIEELMGDRRQAMRISPNVNVIGPGSAASTISVRSGSMRYTVDVSRPASATSPIGGQTQTSRNTPEVSRPAGPAPTIEITRVPPYGLNGLMEGRVVGIDPRSHRVATYIHVEGAGWWAKPVFIAPTVPINSDGTFAVGVTTGGLDNRATLFCAAVVPADVKPPPAFGSCELPAGLEAIAINCVQRYGRKLEFAGYTWGVKDSPNPVGPGNNRFSTDPSDVYVDEEGLHLTVRFHDGNWWATEVVLLETLGYGTYLFQTNSELHDLDVNVVFGAFTWDPYGDTESQVSSNREIYFEDSRWGNKNSPTSSQMVVRAQGISDGLHRYTLPDLHGDPALTRLFTWRRDQVRFVAMRGHHSRWDYPRKAIIDEWTYEHDPSRIHYVPTPKRETFRFNLWLNSGMSAPANSRSVQVVVKSFLYTSLRPAVDL